MESRAPEGGEGREAPDLLPHRYPFLLVDRVVEFEAGRRLLALKNVTRNEPYFSGHFPGRPIVPGVLLCESLAQAGGLLVLGTVAGGLEIDRVRPGDLSLVLSSLDGFRFRRPVVPGDQLWLEVELERSRRPLWKVRGRARVEGQLAAEGRLSVVEVGVGQALGRSVAGVSVHPTAEVAPGAELDRGVRVDSYAYVGPGVRLGQGTHVMHHATVDGATTTGADNRIFPFAHVGCLPQDLKYRGERGELVLGDRNLVREFATLSIGTAGGGMRTVVGNDNLFMNYSHVGHDCRIGDFVRVANGVPLAGHVEVGDHAIVSGLAAVAQFVRIGESAFIGGGSMVVMDVPPFCIANGDRARLKGLNLVGLERRGFPAEEIQALKRAYRWLFQSKLLVSEALARIRSELAASPGCARLADFVEAAARGVTRP